MTTISVDTPSSAADPLPARRLTVALRRFAAWLGRPRTIGLITLILIFVAFYCWTVETSGAPMTFRVPQGDYYNQLADAFLHGHLALLTKPPPALVHLSDPYNPALNATLAGPFHDLALYRGHFYLAWGPTAAILFFIPWRILGLGEASQPFAIVVFSSLGLVFATALLCWLVDRYLSAVRNWKIFVGVFALGLSSVAPFLMRRPAQYEVAISCAYLFVCAGLWALISGSFGDRFRPIRVAFGSACIGLAILSRVDLAVLVLFPVGVFVREWVRRGRPVRRSVLGFAGPSLVPVTIVVAMMLAYNYLRFSAFFQFGSIYQLAGVEQLKNFNYRLSSIAPGMFYYFVAPIQWTLAFPFFLLSPLPYYPWVVPGYMQTEQSTGILTSIPILSTLFVAPFALRRKLPRDLAWLCAALALAGLVVGIVISWGIPGTTQRYETDFATLLLLPALICWMAFMEPDRSKMTRVLSRVIGTLLVVYGGIVGAGLSITGYYDELRVNAPSQYVELGNAFGFVPQFVTLLVGHPTIVKDTYLCGNGECGVYAPALSNWTLNDGSGVELDVASPTGGWQISMRVFDTDRNFSGDTFTIENGPHYQRVYQTHRRQRTIYVPLQGGLNRIDVIVPGKRRISVYNLKTERVGQKPPPAYVGPTNT